MIIKRNPRFEVTMCIRRTLTSKCGGADGGNKGGGKVCWTSSKVMLRRCMSMVLVK